VSTTDGNRGGRSSLPAAPPMARPGKSAEPVPPSVVLDAPAQELPRYQRLMADLPGSVGALLGWRAARRPDGEAFRAPTADGAWRSLTWAQALAAIDEYAAGLVGLGVALGEPVAIASSTRLEAVLSTLAVARAGGVGADVYPAMGVEEVAFVLGDAEACVAVVEDAAQLATVGDRWGSLPHLQAVVVLDRSALGPGSRYAGDRRVLSLDDLRERGRALLAGDGDVVERRTAAVGPHDVATLAYTAGATGRPKGALLRHSSWVHEGAALAATGLLTDADLQLGWLSTSQPTARALLAAQLVVGFAAGFCGDELRPGERLRQVRPTFLAALPRTYEAACAQVRTQQADPWRARLTAWALGIGSRARADGPPVTPPARPVRWASSAWLSAQHRVADRLVLRGFRRRLGGRVRFLLSCSAPLDPGVVGAFRAVGVPLLNCYGLAEGPAVGLLGRPGGGWADGAARPLPGTRARLAIGGDVLLRGPGVMLGYHRRPEATEAVLDDGWLRTGDIGEIVDGRLRVIGRRDELIIMATGRPVRPQEVEARFRGLCPYVSQVVVQGQGRRRLTALVALDPDAMATWASRHGMAGTPYPEVVTSAPVHQLVRRYLDRLNEELRENRAEENRAEGRDDAPVVDRFGVLPGPLTVEAGDLTPAGEPRRAAVARHHRDLLDEIYRD
jgi:long-chain acyl-CoA synthetase